MSEEKKKIKMKYIILLIPIFLLNFQGFSQKKDNYNINKQNFINLENKTFTFEEITKSNKGQTVYLFFWADWCGVCKKEVNKYIQVYRELKDKNIAFVYISASHSKQSWRKALDDLKIKKHGTHFHCDIEELDQFWDTFKLKGVPQFVVIDSEGNINDKNAPWPTILAGNKYMQNATFFEK